MKERKFCRIAKLPSLYIHTMFLARFIMVCIPSSSCGAYPDVETIGKKFAKVVDTVEPDPELVAKYEERYQKFRTLYPAMKPLF